MDRKRAIVVVFAVGFVASAVGSFLGNLARQSSKTDTDVVADLPLPADGVVVCYLYGNIRSAACVDAEQYVREAVESGFPEQIKAGKLHWRAVNYEEPRSEHWATECQIAAPALMLVRMSGGTRTQWKIMADVEELAEDKPAYVEMVRNSVRDFLEVATTNPR